MALLFSFGHQIQIISNQFTNILKNSFQRFRPCYTESIQGLFRPIDCEGRGKYGFTSAHASNHMAIAIFMGILLRVASSAVLHSISANISCTKVFINTINQKFRLQLQFSLIFWIYLQMQNQMLF